MIGVSRESERNVKTEDHVGPVASAVIEASKSTRARKTVHQFYGLALRKCVYFRVVVKARRKKKALSQWGTFIFLTACMPTRNRKKPQSSSLRVLNAKGKAVREPPTWHLPGVEEPGITVPATTTTTTVAASALAIYNHPHRGCSNSNQVPNRRFCEVDPGIIIVDPTIHTTRALQRPPLLLVVMNNNRRSSVLLMFCSQILIDMEFSIRARHGTMSRKPWVIFSAVCKILS